MSIFKGFGRDLIAAFKRTPPEQRSIDSLPWIQGGPISGRMVDPSAALSLIPYFASVRTLAEQISALPLQTYRKDGEISKRITDGSLIRQPGAYARKVTWVRQCVISLAMRGNAFGIITGFDGFGFPTGIEWAHPDEIHVDDSSPTMPRYWWASTVGGYGEVPRERMVHIPWFAPPGRVEGLSPVGVFAESIGVGLSAQRYGSSWFQNGGVPPATFKNTAKTISNEQADEITSRLVASLRSGRPLTFGADWDFNAIQISPEESQFIQTMRMNATQIAAIFGIPPEWVGGETGGSLTYNSPEQNREHVYNTVLLPWLTLIEDHLTPLLPERQFVKFNPDGVLRGNTKDRYDAHKVGIDAGFLTVDEAREMENRPPLPKPRAPKPVAIEPDPNNPPSTIARDPAPEPTPEPQPNNGGTNGRKYPTLSGKRIR